MSTLVSFIGKAKEDKTGARKYQRTKYRFPDGTLYETTFFGSALAKKFSEELEQVIFIGTTGSTWGELIELLEEDIPEDLLHIADSIERMGEIDGNLLQRFGESLSNVLGYKVSLVAVDNDPQNAHQIREGILESLSTAGKAPEKVIFDITHSYRYMPYVGLLSIIPLRYMGVKNIEAYYGFLEAQNEDGSKPVIKLDLIDDLIRLTESLSVFHNTGNFSDLGAWLFPEHKDLFNRLYFKLETNQRPKEEIKEATKLERKDIFSRHLIENIESLNRAKLLEDRLIHRARFFLERRQYLKVIILIDEAILIKHERKYKIKEWKEILRLRSKDPNTYNTLNKFRKLRNSIVHGSEPQGEHAGEIKNMLKDEATLREFIQEVLNLYEKL